MSPIFHLPYCGGHLFMLKRTYTIEYITNYTSSQTYHLKTQSNG
jgi:hypothetical protein